MPPCTRLTGSTTRSAALLASTLAATLLLNLTTTVPVARAGKPAPPPPPVVLPPPRYLLTWLDGGPGWRSLVPGDINRWGDVAGSSIETSQQDMQRAFAYSSTSGSVFDLNVLNAPWWDLNAATPTPAAGWWAWRAHGINDSGAIVGWATNVDPNSPKRAFVLEDAFGDSPRFLLLPTVGAASHYGHRINNDGEVVGYTSESAVIRFGRVGDTWPIYNAVRQVGLSTNGVMDINDDGVIVVRSSDGSYRQLAPGAAPTYFAGHEFWSVSNGGAAARISGLRGFTRKGAAGGPMRLPVLGGANDVQILYSSGLYARSVNDDGDVVFESSGRGQVYYDAFIPNTGTRYGTNGDGVLPLDRLVVNQDA